MTKREYFVEIANFLTESGKTEWAEVVNKEVERLSKTSHSKSKPTANQEANAALKEGIVAYLTAEGEPKRINDIAANVEGLSDASNQKLNSLLIQLRKEGLVKRVKIKKDSFFTIGNENENEEVNE